MKNKRKFSDVSSEDEKTNKNAFTKQFKDDPKKLELAKKGNKKPLAKATTTQPKATFDDKPV